MLSAFEFQVSAQAFAKSVLATLRSTTRCPPPPFLDLQIQNIVFREASLRFQKEGVFIMSVDRGPWGQGLPSERINGKIAQLSIAVTLETIGVNAIHDAPNTLVPGTVGIYLTLLFDLSCRCLGGGEVALSYELTDIDPDIPPGLGVTEEEVISQISAGMRMRPQVIDLQDALAEGNEFTNAGLTLDNSRLVVRAEVANDASLVLNRWTPFHNGNAPDRLGPHDWAVFVKASDMKLMLRLPIEQGLKEALGGDAWRLITVDVTYLAMGDTVKFIVTPYLNLPTPGTTTVPIDFIICLDPVTKRLVVDLDARGIRDLIDDGKMLVYILVGLLAPQLLLFTIAVLNKVASDLEDWGSSALGGTLQDAVGDGDKLPEGSTFEELPGEPFRYRVAVPPPEAPLMGASFHTLLATADGFSLTGGWQVEEMLPGHMSVDVSSFGWQAPIVACGALGENVLRHFPENPKKFASLYAEIVLDQPGSIPGRICSIQQLEGPGASDGLRITYKSETLPTIVELYAPSSFADISPPQPVRLEVRTTCGVFHALFPPPPPLTPEDINRMRSIIEARLMWCDSIVIPPWFEGNGRFDMAWLVDPLVDPDYGHKWVSWIRIEASSLGVGSQLDVSNASGETIISAPIDRRGNSSIAFAVEPRMRGIALGISGVAEARDVPETERGIAFTAEMFERSATFDIPDGTAGGRLMAARSPGGFLHLDAGRLTLIDVSRLGRPLSEPIDIARTYVDGVPLGANILLYGSSGIALLDSTQRVRPLDDKPVRDAAIFGRGALILRDEELELLDDAGRSVQRIPVQGGATGLVLGQASLHLTSPEGRTEVFALRGNAIGDSHGFSEGPAFEAILRSAFNAAPYGRTTSGELVELNPQRGRLVLGTSYALAPWSLRAARSSLSVIAIGDDGRLSSYRSTGPARPIRNVAPG